MAKVDIDVSIEGVEKIDRLNDELKKVEKSSQSVSTKAVAMGNIYAELARTAVEAFTAIHESATEYQTALDEVNGATDGLAQRQESLSTSFGQLSASILNTSDETSAYNTTLRALDGAMLRITSFITDKSIPALIAEQEAVINNDKAKKQAIETTKENTKALEAEAKAYAQAQRALSFYNAQQQKKVDAHKEEIEILRELIYIYEEQGRNTDSLILKLEKMEQTDVLAKKSIREKAEALAEATSEVEKNTQATEDNTQSTKENTEGITLNTQATKEGTEAKETYSSSAGTISGAESYAKNVMGFTSVKANEGQTELLNELKRLNQISQDSNDALRGY